MTLSSAGEEPLSLAVDAIVSAARELGASPRTTSQGVRDSDEARRVLGRLEQALSSVAVDDAGPALRQVRAAQAELAAGDIARQRSMLPVLHDERWVPRSAHMADGPRSALALVEAGGPPFVHTRDLLEVDVVRARRPLLALDVEGNPRVHQRLWAVTHSRSYVAAPVVARGRVAALVHLDRNTDSGTTDAFDRDLLAAFCQGVGLMLDHLLAYGGAVGDVPRHLDESWVTALTSRELDVLQLVAAGLTNVEIGRRLFVSDETVKTHLRRLMRKLGVSKRSQATAIYARLGGTAQREPASA